MTAEIITFPKKKATVDRSLVQFFQTRLAASAGMRSGYHQIGDLIEDRDRNNRMGNILSMQTCPLSGKVTHILCDFGFLREWLPAGRVRVVHPAH